jgi:hypothetical protein
LGVHLARTACSRRQPPAPAFPGKGHVLVIGPVAAEERCPVGESDPLRLSLPTGRSLDDARRVGRRGAPRAGVTDPRSPDARHDATSGRADVLLP